MSSLADVKLVIPGDCRKAKGGGAKELAYQWPCGCRAYGPTESSLHVDCCELHRAFLNEVDPQSAADIE